MPTVLFFGAKKSTKRNSGLKFHPGIYGRGPHPWGQIYALSFRDECKAFPSGEGAP